MDKSLELECKLMQETIKQAKELNKLQVRYIDKNLTPMQKIAEGDLVDLRASRIFSVVWNEQKQENEKIEKTFPYHYKAGETIFIRLGFAMRLPENKKANVYPRSSTFNNYGLLLTNSVGQIDNSYNGSDNEWCAMFWATRDGLVNYDDRILQFDISERTMENIEFELVEQLEDINRGSFGSTGVK